MLLEVAPALDVPGSGALGGRFGPSDCWPAGQGVQFPLGTRSCFQRFKRASVHDKGIGFDGRSATIRRGYKTRRLETFIRSTEWGMNSAK